MQTTKVDKINGSISPLKAWWEDPDPPGHYQVTSHNEWGVVYVVKSSVTESFEQTIISDRTLFITGGRYKEETVKCKCREIFLICTTYVGFTSCVCL